MSKTDLRIVAGALLSFFTDAGTRLLRHINRKVITFLGTLLIGIESQGHTPMTFQTPGDTSLYIPFPVKRVLTNFVPLSPPKAK